MYTVTLCVHVTSSYTTNNKKNKKNYSSVPRCRERSLKALFKSKVIPTLDVSAGIGEKWPF